MGPNEGDTAFCAELDRRLGRSPSLTPGRGESSAFISDLDSASENRAQSEPERLREGLGRLVGAAGCWVGMTTARLPGARRSGIRVGTHCATGSKDRRGRKRVSHPSGNSRQAARNCALDHVNLSPAMRRNRAARPQSARYAAPAIQRSSALAPVGASSPSLTFANSHRHRSHDCGS